MATAANLSQEQIAQYRAAARRRHRSEQRALAVRERRAWELARRAATLLRERYRTGRVVLFGSLARPGCFTAWSDVDVAAWGLEPGDASRASEELLELDETIAVTLVDADRCSESVLTSIERTGLPL
jgi:predicted nucleotidyltransferase